MDDRTITIARDIAASPERVWRCWTDPGLLPRWFGPEGFSCHTKEIDLNEGGIWRFDMIGPDGTVFPNRHRILRHDRPRRIEFLLDADDDGAAPMQVLVLIEPTPQGCRLTQTITFPTAEARAGALGFGADRLGLQTLAQLATIAEALETS